MPPTRRERDKTKRYYHKREQVVDIAVELFSKNGYASTGVADIGEAAGLARGALYYYIGSKEALLAEIHDRVMDPLLKEAEAIVKLTVSFQARLRLLSESLLWQIVHRSDHVWVFLHEYRQLQGEYRELFREKRHRFESYILDVLTDGRGQGMVRMADLEIAKLAFLNLHNYTYQWIDGRKNVKVEDLASLYCEIFLNGILTERGEQAIVESQLAGPRAMLHEMRRVD